MVLLLILILLASWLTALPEYADFQSQFDGVRYKWEPKNSVKDFFKTGTIATISLNVKGRSEDNKINYGLAFSHLNDKGLLQENSVTRNNLTISGSAKLSNKFNARGSMTYTRTDLKHHLLLIVMVVVFNLQVLLCLEICYIHQGESTFWITF